MEFITLWTFSQSWALKNLLNLYWADADAAAKHSVMEVFSALFFSYLCGGECLEDINALIGQFRQRPDTLLPSADTVGTRTEGACRREHYLQERNLRHVLQFQHGREAKHLTFTNDTKNGAYKGGQLC